MDKPLENQVALVAGATRGAGRGIAIELAAAGALVYCSGRSSRAMPRAAPAGSSAFDLAHRRETIEETAEIIESAGNRAIAVCTDHRDFEAVALLVARIRREHGRLDVLVNDIWGGDALTEWGKPFWELDLAKGFELLERAIRTHVVTSRAAVPMLVERRQGLVVEVTDGDALYYRSNLFYDLAKTAVIRLAFAMAEELREHGVTALAVTPGFLRSEAMLDHFGVSAEDWRDATAKDPHFAFSETPRYVGRAIAALAADPGVFEKSGGVYSSWGLSAEYGFTDVDGSKPDFGAHALAEDFGKQQLDSHRRFVALRPGAR
jgi:NAD(P)-dependent dehydrogenase (short-subunit alcohol dehydrogenase family)